MPTATPIRYRDLDTNGHVTSSVYMTYLEQERVRVLGGIDWYARVLATITITYRSELRMADGEAIATCRLVRVGTSSVTTSEELRAPDGRLAAEAQVVLVCWDGERRSSRPFPDDVRAHLERQLEPPA